MRDCNAEELHTTAESMQSSLLSLSVITRFFNATFSAFTVSVNTPTIYYSFPFNKFNCGEFFSAEMWPKVVKNEQFVTREM